MPFPVLHDFNFAGDDLVARSLHAISRDILLGAYPSDDVDTASFLQLVEMLDEIPFPCDDAVPCRFDNCAPVLCLEAVVGCDGEVGSFGVSEVLYVNAPDDASDFDFVQLFHNGLIFECPFIRETEEAFLADDDVLRNAAHSVKYCLITLQPTLVYQVVGL